MKEEKRKTLKRAVLKRKGFRLERAAFFMTIILPLLTFVDKSLADEELICDSQTSCPDPEFCNYDLDESGFCELCPLYSELCTVIGLPMAGVEECDEACSKIGIGCSAEDGCLEGMFCNGEDDDDATCEYCPPSLEQCDELGLPEDGVDNCIAACVTGYECTVDDECPPGLFCNVSSGFSGICEFCPPVKYCDDIGLPEEAVTICQEVCRYGCEDSPLPAAPFDETCANAIEYCDVSPRVPSHCPRTCDTCDEYECKDSQLPFVIEFDDNVFTASCAMLANLGINLREDICYNMPKVAITCRGTCENCA